MGQHSFPNQLSRISTNARRYLLSLLVIIAIPFSNNLQAEMILRLHGSNTIGAELGPALAKQYLETKLLAKNVRYLPSDKPQEGWVVGEDSKSGSPIEIEIHAHGSSTAFQDLDAGRTDIGMASRQIKTSEVSRLRKIDDFTSVNSEFVVGLDGIAVIVPRTNTTQFLSKQQLTDIFSGKITNWRQLGQPGGPIHVYARDDKSGTYDTFKSLVLGKRASLVADARRYESNAQLSDDVAADPHGIGFVGLPYIRNSRAIPISDGDSKARYPSEFNVVTEDYALSRRLYLYASSKSANPHVHDFLSFAVSQQGQQIVLDNGFVSQNLYLQNLEIGQNYPEEYRTFVQQAKRLSVNFRFRQDSLELDSRAIRDLDRVASYIRDHSQIRKVMLFGFSEDTGIPIYDISLSESRADMVERALHKRGVVVHHVRGYGAIDPVSVNTVKHKNRRVEVWIEEKS